MTLNISKKEQRKLEVGEGQNSVHKENNAASATLDRANKPARDEVRKAIKSRAPFFASSYRRSHIRQEREIEIYLITSLGLAMAASPESMRLWLLNENPYSFSGLFNIL
jgi:hypothetical protein